MKLTEDSIKTEVMVRKQGRDAVKKIVSNPTLSFNTVLLLELARIEGLALKKIPLSREDIVTLKLIQDNLKELQRETVVDIKAKKGEIKLINHIRGKR